MSDVRRWTWPMVTPGSIGRGLRAIGATLPCGRCDDVVMRTRCQGGGPGVMATIRRHPAAAGLAFLPSAASSSSAPSCCCCARSARTPPPGCVAAQGMAHRLLTGRESIDTDVQRDGEYVFRVVYQTSDGDVGATLAATHIGVAVCLRGDTADRGGALLLPALQAGVPRRAAAADPGGDLHRRGPRGVRRRLRDATPTSATSRSRGGSARRSRTGYFLVRMLASTQAWRLTWP